MNHQPGDADGAPAAATTDPEALLPTSGAILPDAQSATGVLVANDVDTTDGSAAPDKAALEVGDDTVAEDEFGAGIRMFHAFRYRDYRWLWLGNTFSSAAMWIQQTTMGYIAYDLTGSGALLGAINGVRNLPNLAATPIAGVAADRFSRNLVVATSQLLLFITALLLALALELHVLQVWHLFAFAIVAGTLNAFNQPARQTMVFDVVPREAAPNAIALNSIGGNVTRTLGPAIGGALIVFFGPANNFLVQAMAYLGVMVTVLMIRRFPPRLSSARRRSFFRDMADGYAWAMSNPRARLLVLMMVLYPTFMIPVHLGLMPILTKEVFHAGAGGLGLLLSSLGLGGIIGGFLAAALNKVDRRGLVQLLALFVNAGFMAIFGIVGGLTGNLWAGLALLCLSGIGGSLFNTTNQTVLQLVAPDEMRGRITGILNVQPLFQSVGVIAAGIAADLVGAASVAAFEGLCMFSIGLAILVFSPRMRDLRLSKLGE